jgi:hypothetical protein
MANWCECELEICGDPAEVRRFRDAVTGGESLLSFQKVVPCPQALVDTDENTTGRMGYDIFFNPDEDAWKKYICYSVISEHIERAHPGTHVLEELVRTNNRAQFQREIEEHCPSASSLKEDGQQRQVNLVEYGYHSWYDWRYANWGVKWDVSDAERDDMNVDDGLLNYQFLCPWNAPVAFVENVSRLFPTLTFTIRGSDPEMAYHVDENITNGVVI